MRIDNLARFPIFVQIGIVRFDRIDKRSGIIIRSARFEAAYRVKQRCVDGPFGLLRIRDGARFTRCRNGKIAVEISRVDVHSEAVERFWQKVEPLLRLCLYAEQRCALGILGLGDVCGDRRSVSQRHLRVAGGDGENFVGNILVEHPDANQTLAHVIFDCSVEIVRLARLEIGIRPADGKCAAIRAYVLSARQAGDIRPPDRL